MRKTASQMADEILMKVGADVKGIQSRSGSAFGDLDAATPRKARSRTPAPAVVRPKATTPAPASKPAVRRTTRTLSPAEASKWRAGIKQRQRQSTHRMSQRVNKTAP